MSRKGNCYDNAVMENFFGLLKQEIYHGRIFNSFDELKNEIIEWIEYYNTYRIKKKLNWISMNSTSSLFLENNEKFFICAVD